MVGILSHSRGDTAVSYEELQNIQPLLPQTASYYPTKHVDYVDTCFDLAERALTGNEGYTLQNVNYLVNKDEGRMFFNFDYDPPDKENGHRLTVIGRSSTDKSMSYAFGIGMRVVICSNLMLNADFLVINKHTRNATTQIRHKVRDKLDDATSCFRDSEKDMERMRQVEFTEDQGLAYLARAYNNRVLGERMIRPALHAWDNPSYNYGRPSLWSAYNTVTEQLRDVNIKQQMEGHRRLHKFTQETYFPQERTEIEEMLTKVV